MGDVQGAITFVATCCRVLLASGNTADRRTLQVLDELKCFLDELPKVLLLDVANLALVSLRVLLRSTSSSSVKEACLEVMTVCFRRGALIGSQQLFEDLLKNLLLVLDPPPMERTGSAGGVRADRNASASASVSNQRQLTPELVFAAANCLRAMVSVAPENAEYEGFVARVLQDPLLRITLGHCIHSLLSVASSPSCPRNCRQVALLALRSCMRAVDSASILSFFFPGIVGTLVKIASGDFKNGSKVIVEAIEAFGDVSCIVLSHKECLPIMRSRGSQKVNDGRGAVLSESEGAVLSEGACSSLSGERGDARGVESDHLGVDIPQVKRTSEWLETTLRHYGTALGLLFSQKQQFVLSTFGFRVQMALMKCSSRILVACGSVLGPSVCMLCDFLMIHLARSMPREIYTAAWNAILAFSASLEQEQDCEEGDVGRLRPVVELFQCLTDHVLELVADFGRGFGVPELDSIRGSSVSPLSEVEKRNHILRVTGYIRLFAEARKAGALASAAGAFLRSVSDEVRVIVSRLLAIADLISSAEHAEGPFRPLSDAVTAHESGRGDDDLLFAARGHATARVLKRANFRYFTDEAVLFSVFDLCDVLGRYAGGIHALPLLVAHLCGDAATVGLEHGAGNASEASYCEPPLRPSSAIVLLPKIVQGACCGGTSGELRVEGKEPREPDDAQRCSVLPWVERILPQTTRMTDSSGTRTEDSSVAQLVGDSGLFGAPSCATEVTSLQSVRPETFARRFSPALFAELVDCVRVLVSPRVFGWKSSSQFFEVDGLLKSSSEGSFAGAGELEESSRVNSELRSCLVLDALGQLFGLCGPLSNDLVPFVLYPVTERLASPSALVAETAKNALALLCAACGFDCVPDLLLNSSDVMLDAIGHRLRHLEWYPDTLRVFSSVLKLSGPSTLTLVDDCLGAILTALASHRTASYSYEFLRVLIEILHLVEQSEELASLRRSDVVRRDEKTQTDSLGTCEAECKKPCAMDEISAFFKDYHDRHGAGDKGLDGGEENGEETGEAFGDGGDSEVMPIGGAAEKRWLQCKELALADRILRASVVQLYSRSMRVRILALDILELGIRLLVPTPTLLFPLLHSMWSAVLTRVRDSECPVTVSCMKLIQTMAAAAPAFMFARLVNGAAPEVLRSADALVSRYRAEWLVADARTAVEVASNPFFKAVCAMMETMVVLLSLQELHADQHSELFHRSWSGCVVPFVGAADAQHLPAELVQLSESLRDIVLRKCGGQPAGAAQKPSIS